MRCSLTTKIIFSDGTVQFLKADDTKMCEQLKDAQSDKTVLDLMQKLEGSFEFCEAADADETQCTVDLHKKKRASIKRMLNAFGGKR